MMLRAVIGAQHGTPLARVLSRHNGRAGLQSCIIRLRHTSSERRKGTETDEHPAACHYAVSPPDRQAGQLRPAGALKSRDREVGTLVQYP